MSEPADSNTRNATNPQGAPTVPVDDAAIDAIEHALDGAYKVSEDGEHTLAGADYTLDRLLDFWAGIDPNEEGALTGHSGGVPTYLMPGVYLTPNDVIRALIAEVRRLRGERQ